MRLTFYPDTVTLALTVEFFTSVFATNDFNVNSEMFSSHVMVLTPRDNFCRILTDIKQSWQRFIKQSKSQGVISAVALFQGDLFFFVMI